MSQLIETKAGYCLCHRVQSASNFKRQFSMLSEMLGSAGREHVSTARVRLRGELVLGTSRIIGGPRRPPPSTASSLEQGSLGLSDYRRGLFIGSLAMAPCYTLAPRNHGPRSRSRPLLHSRIARRSFGPLAVRARRAPPRKMCQRPKHKSKARVFVVED